MAASDTSSHRSSRDYRHLAGQSFMELPGSKRSLFRGKKSKRLSGQFSPSFDVDEVQEVETLSKRESVLRKGRRMMNQSEDSLHHLKNRISTPFDFQHVTHTDRHQFAALEQATEEHLATEFWAVRTSQAPRRDLTGIKAENLHFQNFSSENLTAPQSRSASALGLRSPPLNPDPSCESPESTKSIRMTRSVESFSQPSLSPRLHRHTQSANPPPRVSSRLPLTRIDDLPEEPSDANKSLPRSPIRARSNRYSGFWDKFAPLSPALADNKLPTMTEEPSYVAHAVTTPDDSAIHPMTPSFPSFSPDLGDVAEEPEEFTNPRSAPHPPPRSPKSPFFDSFSFNNNQRSPVSRPNSRRNSNPRGPITRPISQMSDTLGSPSRKVSIRRAPSVRRKSNTWRAIEESWEDDVDFIYDNALEADCDFDWDRSSDNGAYEDRDRTPEQQDHARPSTTASQSTQTPSMALEDEPTTLPEPFHSVFPRLFVPSPGSVPELESRSAISASTDNGAQTPSDFFNHMGTRKGSLAEGFSLTPSLLVPADFKEQVAREDMYDDLLADYEGSDRHFPLLDASQSVASSTRSSHVRSSKRSSYDSSLMSASQGSGSWNSPIRRSASSSGSLPELVHSRRARRDFNLMVDRLSEQVTSCASFDDDDAEDNDTTPPGRQSRDQTFFASEDEEPETQTLRVSIEGEVRASLELARRGSTRSSRAPLHYHKYASSDGATKLLTSQSQQTPKSRTRAASSSNAIRANRQPYLSLFPVPPKHMPQS
ncbi:hypothetical protein K505DRAFT_359870 [Melanomma pulvis-pyrius CBS 109.77]|uniref:CRIB domain-containing protein n=1 Tax=Melanomma pulvis-pyrius CBS 109.77 TaxID=1314802 RepID=A0A6A6XJM7_9PLEO|nr:hypothetical protein K505DRAFT_359870 [Melanomma pulvis-pyrius CBS 109.77]